VRVDCYAFTKLSSCRRSFFDWATPVKLYSIIICMLIDCLLGQFLGSIQERVRTTTPPIEARSEKTREFHTQLLHYFRKSDNKSNHHQSASHIECMSSTNCNSRLSTCVYACRLSRLLRAGLTVFVKRCYIISRTSFTSSASTPCSLMMFRKSARESHTLPPAKLLRQNSTGLASDFRLRSTFDVVSSDSLSSDVSLPLSAWNCARVSLCSMHSANTVGEHSNFLTLALHLLSVDCRSKPFQSTRFRYSRVRNWVVRWSSCASGTCTRAFGSPFDVADNLSCHRVADPDMLLNQSLRLCWVDLRRFRTLPF